MLYINHFDAYNCCYERMLAGSLSFGHMLYTFEEPIMVLHNYLIYPVVVQKIPVKPITDVFFGFQSSGNQISFLLLNRMAFTGVFLELLYKDYAMQKVNGHIVFHWTIGI